MKKTIIIMMKDLISVDLALRNRVVSLFEYINSLSQIEVVVDFTGIKSISRSFAHEYINQKNDSKKKISEVNLPINVKKMFKVVEQPSEKTDLLDLKTLKVASL